MTKRLFRFGLQASSAPDSRSWADLARKAEDLGFSSLLLPDHFGNQLSPAPALVAAADATTTLRVGTLVLDNDFRHPVVMAKEMATVDVMSGGRLELGLGAGWMTTDYEQSGIAHDPPGTRISRLEEAISVVKGLFGPGAFTFEGNHYRVDGLDGFPKPVQQPSPPLILGGGGKRMLELAAREADIIGINPSMHAGVVGADAAADATGAATDRKVQWVREAAGPRFDEIELSALSFAVVLTDDRPSAQAMVSQMFGVDPESVSDVPHVWVGSVDEICDDLQRWRERWGLSYLVVQADAIDNAAEVVARLSGT